MIRVPYAPKRLNDSFFGQMFDSRITRKYAGC